MKMDATSDRPILRSSNLAAGTGAPVLLLHGSASAGVMWVPVIDALKSRFRVIAPDLIGYGRTDSWPDGYGFVVDDELRLVSRCCRTRQPVSTWSAIPMAAWSPCTSRSLAASPSAR
jgi:pimeloyl-ACP methyl ester carboxylesterase